MEETGPPVILAAELRYQTGHLAGFWGDPLVYCRLERHQLSWEVRSHLHTLAIQDMLSVSPYETPKTPFGIRIQACPCARPQPWAPRRRRLISYRFACQTQTQQTQWQQALNTLLQVNRQSPALKHLLVILNPASGRGRARHRWAQVEPLFQHSQIQITIVQPTSPAALTTVLSQTCQSCDYDGIVVVGGDGTVHDVLNGLHPHPDAPGALPLGVIPAGTGNGLCQSLLAESGEPFDPISAAWIIIQGHPQPIDLLQVTHGQRQRLGILSLAWGLISDIDLGSESLRWLGALRSDLYTLLCILRLRSYSGQLDIQTQVDGPWQFHTGRWLALWVLNVPWATQTIKAAPQAQLADGYMDLLWVKAGVSRWQLLWTFFNLSRGQVLASPDIQSVKVTRLRLMPHHRQGRLALDGEHMATDAIEMEVQARVGRVFRR